MVFGSDFRQIPPVIKCGSRAEVVSSCLNRSYLCRHVKVMKLTINMRLQILSVHEVCMGSLNSSELCIASVAIAGIDTVIIDCIDANSATLECSAELHT